MAGTWVDLKGEKGTTGGPGDTGAAGADGADAPEVSATEPTTPFVGQLWFDTSTTTLKVCTSVA